MVYTQKIQNAIQFSLETHEIHRKQKRKGKDIPYIVHPLQVGLILAKAGCDEDIIAAGILHDTIEDSVEEMKVTKSIIIDEFGSRVADIVASVSDSDKSLSWEERKAQATEHIGHFSNDSVLVKSADVIANATELFADIKEHGESVFERFNAPKERILSNYHNVITALILRWPGNPLASDLQNIVHILNDTSLKT